MPRIASGNNFLSGFGTNDYLEDYFTDRVSNRSPFINITESEEDYKLEIGLPGFKKNDLEITLRDTDLIISGSKKIKENQEKDSYKRHEFDYSDFYKSFHLPGRIDLKNISAKFKDGLLNIQLPKKEGYDIAQSVIKIK